MQDIYDQMLIFTKHMSCKHTLFYSTMIKACFVHVGFYKSVFLKQMVKIFPIFRTLVTISIIADIFNLALIILTLHYLGVPGKPEKLHPTGVTEDTVTLKWQRPRDNGGSQITAYTVEKRQHPDGKWERVSEKGIPKQKHVTYLFVY